VSDGICKQAAGKAKGLLGFTRVVVSDETLPMLWGDRSNITGLSYVLAYLVPLDRPFTESRYQLPEEDRISSDENRAFEVICERV